MKVKDRMSVDVLTVNLETYVSEASELMKENKVRRVPVMDEEKLVGIVTENDLYRVSPSTATTLSKNELNYLLAKLKIRDILPKNQQVVTVHAEDFIEVAARLMREHTISGLPVMEDGLLVGIITESDIFNALIDILGVKKKHTRIDIRTTERLGAMAEMTGIFARNQANILNTVVFYDQSQEDYKVIFRLEGEVQAALAELKSKYHVVSVVEMEPCK